MIEWMQTHKKWLIITIWIATIAFILAGAVGWGSLSFGRKRDTLVKIGDTQVRIGDLQQIYNVIYDRVNRQMGGKLDDATATKMGLKQKALQIAVEQGYFRELTRRLGLEVVDQEVANLLQKIFKTPETYSLFLQRLGMTKRDYEEIQRHQLIVGKFFNTVSIDPFPLTIEGYGSALYVADRLKIKLLSVDEVNATVTPKEIEEYYQKHKEQFLTQPIYQLQIVEIPIEGEVNQTEIEDYYSLHRTDYTDSEGAILPLKQVEEEVKMDYLAHKLKRKAFLSYKNLKNGKINGKFIQLPFNNDELTPLQMEELKGRGYLRPVRIGNKWIVAKLIKIEPPKPKPLSQVSSQIGEALLREKRLQLLEKEGQRLAKTDFEGEDIGYRTKFDLNITGLTPEEGGRLLMEIFTRWKSAGVVIVSPEKVVVYRILAQKLLDRQKLETNKNQIIQLVKEIVNSELKRDMLNELSQLYPIVSYVKDGN